MRAPTSPTDRLPDVLAPLKAMSHWVIWKWEEKNGKRTKVPYQAAKPNRKAKTTDPRTWSDYATAVAAEHLADGIGFCLQDSAIASFDLDKCRNPETCELHRWAAAFVARAASYTEITPSGTGLRIIGFGSGDKVHRKQDVIDDVSLESYRKAERYICMTGDMLPDVPAVLADLDAVMDEIVPELDGAAKKKRTNGNGSGGQASGKGQSAVPPKLIALIADTKAARPGRTFFRVVAWLRKLGWQLADMVALFEQYPEGIAAKFAGRLAAEVERALGKMVDEPLFTDLNKDGGIKAKSCANACVAIEALGIACRYDRFHDQFTADGELLGSYGGEVTDNTPHVLRSLMWEHHRFDPGSDATWDAIRQLCLANEHNPVTTYLDALKWDGTKRINTWLMTYLGAPDTKLNRAIGKIVLVAMVRRAREPGCKFDQIIVLEGPEGTEKSTALEKLAGSKENFSDQTILGERDREQQELLRGIWIYEIADLTGIKRADVDHIKAFASRTHDRARRAWGRTLTAQPRTCIIFATTNDDVYLKSQTGNRRFWPIVTGTIDVKALKRGRDQLLAEAAAAEAKEGFALTLDRGLWSEARVIQAERTKHDPWLDILDDAVRFSTEVDDEQRISTAALYDGLLNIPKERRNWQADQRIKRCMRRLGWQGPKPLRFKANKKPDPSTADKKPDDPSDVARGYCRKKPNPVTDGPPVTDHPHPQKPGPRPRRRDDDDIVL